MLDPTFSSSSSLLLLLYYSKVTSLIPNGGREGERGKYHKLIDFISLVLLSVIYHYYLFVIFFVFQCNSLINFPCYGGVLHFLFPFPLPPSPLFIPCHCQTSLPQTLPTSIPTLSFPIDFPWLPFSVFSFSCSLLGAMLKVNLPLATPPAPNSALLALIKALEIYGVLSIKAQTRVH